MLQLPTCLLLFIALLSKCLKVPYLQFPPGLFYDLAKNSYYKG